MGALAVTDLRQIEGEPRVADLRLGEVLGFGHPVNIRKVIRRNEAELGRYGGVFSTAEKTSDVGGRPGTAYYLNEAQAVILCMFSRTAQAADAREQIVKVFLAWRHGRLERAVQPVPRERKPNMPDRQTRWSQMERRISQIEKAIGLQGKVETPDFARALAYMPNVLFLDHDDGRRRKQSRPRWWYDLPVREAVIEHHRQMTIDHAIYLVRKEFGKARAPSRSSLARFWLTLDAVRAAN